MVTRKALVVGIDNYPHPNKLIGCVNDAKEIASLLDRNDNKEKNFDVNLKENVSSKRELLRLIDDCFKGDYDVALFYFSGHGHVTSTGGYLVTPDFTDYDVGVSLHEILTIVNKSKCKERIVILDCCYSGNMGNIQIGNEDITTIKDGVTILTSCDKDETSTEYNGHGVFTSLLIDALKGGAADILGNITMGGIYAYIDNALGPWEQRPVFKTNVTSFTFIRKVIPQVNVDVIRKLTDYFKDVNEEYKLDPSYEDSNDPSIEHKYIQPYANSDNIKIFKNLQQLESIGVVVPNNSKHMYYAAMESKGCKLTALGKQYWRLVKDNKI